MTDQPSCNNCKHWHGGLVCDAYPQGIPWPIMAGDIAHLKPLPDDHGLQWERQDATAKPIQDTTRPNA